LTDRVDAQREALADAISTASDKDYITWDYAYNHLQYDSTKQTQGGNANFDWTGAPTEIAFVPGADAGGCEMTCRFGGVPSIHAHGRNPDKQPILHLDSASLIWGYGLGAFLHAVIDVGLGNINTHVPMGP
jgi:hypothetical protein